MNDSRGDPRSRRYEALADRNRRRILQLLARSSSGIVAVEEIVAAIVEDAEGSTGDEDSHARVRLRLYHADLPKLAAAGLVDYDWRSGDVRLTAGGMSSDLLFHLVASDSGCCAEIEASD